MTFDLAYPIGLVFKALPFRMSHPYPLTNVQLSVICDYEGFFLYLSQGFPAVFLRTDTSHLNELVTKMSPAKLPVYCKKTKTPQSR